MYTSIGWLAADSAFRWTAVFGIWRYISYIPLYNLPSINWMRAFFDIFFAKHICIHKSKRDSVAQFKLKLTYALYARIPNLHPAGLRRTSNLSWRQAPQDSYYDISGRPQASPFVPYMYKITDVWKERRWLGSFRKDQHFALNLCHGFYQYSRDCTCKSRACFKP